jgi:hypothetical protein
VRRSRLRLSTNDSDRQTDSFFDAETAFRFNCFNIEDGHDPNCGLEYGELVIPGKVLRRDVFDPIVGKLASAVIRSLQAPSLRLSDISPVSSDQVLALIDTQLQKTPEKKVNALILVGGFAASEYLFTRVQETFGTRINVIARPNDCDVATLQGAARYGLGLVGGKAAVSSVISPRSYIMSKTGVFWSGEGES